MKKGNTELLSKINDGLAKIKANGKYAEIYKKWFGQRTTCRRFEIGDRMAKRKAFLKIIKENGPLVLDGAFGTELERHGCNIHDELWSSKMLVENPEIIKKVHISYFGSRCRYY